jgi:hypothetical protein
MVNSVGTGYCMVTAWVLGTDLDSWIEIRKQKYFNKQAVTSCRS